MRQVDVSATMAVGREAVEAALTPRAIVDYEGTYEVVEVRQSAGGPTATVVSEDDGVEMTLAFEELPNGYDYELVGDGPFEELYTAVTLHDDVEVPAGAVGDGGAANAPGTADAADGPQPDGAGGSVSGVRVTMRSEFTFGGWLAPVLDWLAAGTREMELRRALLNLAEELDELDRVAENPDAAE